MKHKNIESESVSFQGEYRHVFSMLEIHRQGKSNCYRP